MKTQFTEKQKFTQWWLWLILISIGIIPIIGIYKQIILGKPFGDNPMSNVGLIVFTVVVFAFIIFFRIIQLRTKIDEQDINIQFYPLINKTIKWSEVKSANIVNYGFVGGWGIRLWTNYGTVYNIKGNMGLALELKNGKKLLIGSQKIDDLKSYINSIN